MIRYAIAVLIIAGTAGMAAATEARIESMGMSDRFTIDDMAMFTNPGYSLVYPSLLTGSMGRISGDSLSEQWFGGWLSVPYSDGQNVVLGAAFNRHDDLEKALMSYGPLKNVQDLGAVYYPIIDSSTWEPDTVLAVDTGRALIVYRNNAFRYDTVDITVPSPVGHTDMFAGYTKGNIGVGAHLFVAYQDSTVDDVKQAASGIVKGDVGVLFKLDERDLVDVSAYVARVTYFRKSTATPVDEAKFSFGLDARAFLTVDMIGGQVVPAFSFSQLALVQDTLLSVEPGVGYQRGIEGGSFWGGLEYAWGSHRRVELGVRDTTVSNAFVFSFGIERQIVWPWFTLRVGGRKTISLNEYRSSSGETRLDVTTNPENDAVGAGVALRVGDRLKFDVTANERLPFSNPLYGDLENMVSRISATYAF